MLDRLRRQCGVVIQQKRDAVLQARCAARRLPSRYPHGFRDLVGAGLPGPWMYTGGLENWPRLVGAMARRRPLWGNGRAVLQAARSPTRWTRALRAAGLPA